MSTILTKKPTPSLACSDLAEQTHENVELFSRFLPPPGLRGTVLVGGTNPKAAERLLAEGVDIVSGTPGRVLDLAESARLNLGSIRFFVLDEAGMAI